MITYLLMVAASVAIATYAIVNTKNSTYMSDVEDWLLAMMGALCGSALISLLIAGVSFVTQYFIVYPNADHAVQSTHTEKVVSLGNSSKIDGHGSYAYAYISQDNTYKMMTQEGDSLSMREVPANTSRIFEDADPGSSYITIKHNDYADPVLRAIFPNLHDDTYEIHIPKDSVVRDFNVDVSK